MNPPTGTLPHRINMQLAALRAKYVGEEPPAPTPLSPWTKAGVALLLILVPTAALYSKHLSSLYDADSLLPSLISLQKLTLFYWGQNRFGNLLPFLTVWIHDINLNFQAQTWLRALGTASIPLFVFEFIGLRRHYLAAFGMALALMFLPFRDMANYAIWVEAEPYGHATLILLVAFLIHHRNECALNKRDILPAAAALLLACLALYVNAGLILFSFPLWLAYSLLYPHRRNWWFTAFLLAGYAVSSLLSTFYGQEYRPAFDYTHMAFHLSNLSGFGNRFASLVSVWFYILLLLVLFIKLISIQRSFREKFAPGSALIDPLVIKSLLIAATAALYILVVSNMEWTISNVFAFRYFWFALVLVPCVCAGVLCGGRRTGREILPAVISAVLMLSAATTKLAPFQVPNSFVEQPKRTDTLALAGIARQYGASFVTGDYYMVWPVVFEAIRKGQAAGDPNAIDIHGLVTKGEHQRDEVTRILRASRRVVVLDIEPHPADFYTHALYFNAADWPPYGSIITEGSLPSGGGYCVLSFDRTPPSPDAPLLPSFTDVMYRTLDVQQGVAERDGNRIIINATNQRVVAWRGPFVNLTAGRYIAGYKIDSRADPSTPLFELAVWDGFGANVYATKKFRASDLESRNGETWATIEFTVPENTPTRAMEFGITTLGNAPFAVDGMELRREE